MGIPQNLCLVLLLLPSWILADMSFTVTTSSTIVADYSNYTYSIINHNNPTTATFIFDDWSANQQSPYTTPQGYQFNTAITCSLPTAKYIVCSLLNTNASTLSIVLTNMYNPSSTKPYNLTLTVSSSSFKNTSSFLLQMSQIGDYPLTLTNYSQSMGASSTAVQFYLNCENYFDSTTIFRLTYPSSIVTINIPSYSSGYTSVNIPGSIDLSNWTSPTNFQQQVISVSITNPPAAVTFTLSGLLFFKSNGTTYYIQSFSDNITLVPASFTTLTTSSPLYFGLTASLVIASSCSYQQVNFSSTVLAYTILTYDPTQISPNSGSNCISQTSTTCKHQLSGASYILTNFLAGITSSSAANLKVTSYTYYSGSAYKLCESSVSIPYALQKITPSINLLECDSAVASQTNNINFYLPLISYSTGDTVVFAGLKGVVLNSAWTTSFSGSTQIWSHTIDSNLSDTLVNSSQINTPIVYNNPNYTTTTNTITQVQVYRGAIQYASMTNMTLPVCAVTSGKTISNSSLTATSLLVYDYVTLTLSLKMQIFDYKSTDYMLIAFKRNNIDDQFAIATTTTVTVAGVKTSFTVVNSTAISFSFGNIVFPSSASPVLKIVLGSISNPAVACQFTMIVITYDGPTGGAKETATSQTLTIATRSLTYSLSRVLLLQNMSLTLVLSNPLRNLDSKNTVAASSQFTLTLPNEIKCPALVNDSVTINWGSSLQTSTGIAVGNETVLTLDLGSCTANYFTGELSTTILQIFLGLNSTSTSIIFANACGDNCYQCTTSGECLSCFSANYTNNTYFYKGNCASGCPINTYLNVTCLDCYSACSSCNGPTYLSCLTCALSFTNSSNLSFCVSICGTGKYLNTNEICSNCHVNCAHCVSPTDCYYCNTGAVLFNGYCQFSSCTSPCSTCEGSLSTCTSCIPQYNLYISQCYDTCPTGTYQSGNTCMVITENPAYIPCTLTSLALLILALIIRFYSNRKIGNDPKRIRKYSVQSSPDNVDVPQPNYKLNIVRFMSVALGYLEIVSGVILLAKNMSYSILNTATALAALGLALHIIHNIVFGIGYYCRVVHKKRIVNTDQVDQQSEEGNEQQQAVRNTSIRNKLILVLSVLICMRTYKLLYANLFLNRDQQSLSTVVKNGAEKSQNSIVEHNSLQKMNKIVKINNKSSKHDADVISSKKPIHMTSSIEPTANLPSLIKTSSFKMIDDREAISVRRFNHPFLTYLTLTSLLASLALIVAAVLEILSQRFTNILLWGIDTLLVTVLSMILLSWDLWIFVNLTKQEQQSQMSSRAEDVNNTHQNLKNQAQIDIRTAKDTSPKKSTLRGKKSNRSISKSPPSKASPKEGGGSLIRRQCEEGEVEKYQHIPVLKVFEDIQDGEQKLGKQIKARKWNAGRKDRASVPYNSRGYSSGNQVGRGQPIRSRLDDIYLNFGQNNEVTTNRQSNGNQSPHSSGRQKNSLKEKSQVSFGQIEGNFEFEHPNFQDISGIENIVKVDKLNPSFEQQNINLSLQDELHLEDDQEGPK